MFYNHIIIGKNGGGRSEEMREMSEKWVEERAKIMKGMRCHHK